MTAGRCFPPCRLLIVGNPRASRVTRFQEALKTAALPAALEVSWLDVAGAGDPFDAAGVSGPTLVRIDSFGGSFDVEQAFLLLGYEDAASAGVSCIAPTTIATLSEDRGRILAPRQVHFGFLRALGRIEKALETRAEWRALSSPEAIRNLFDKRVTSALYGSRGIPVPRALPSVSTIDAMQDAMRDSGLQSVFVKLSCGSSASCVAVYTRGVRDSVVSTVEMATEGWYNTRRLRRYVRAADIDRVLGFLLREGSQVEEHVPKARFDGQLFDCRVLMVAGAPAFLVARRSPHLLTNLHLGATRGDLDRLALLMPEAAFDAALDSCKAVDAIHGCFQLGIDVLFEPDFRGHRVLEGNAFGDFFPGLLRDGKTVYDWEVERLRSELTVRPAGRGFYSATDTKRL